MRLFVVCCLAATVVACTSSTGPKNEVFTGTWTGTTRVAGCVGCEGLTITTTTTQSGGAISGNCTNQSPGPLTNPMLTCALVGTSSPPAIKLTMAFSDSEVVSYAGTYVTPDSVHGTLTRDGAAIGAFSFVKVQGVIPD